MVDAWIWFCGKGKNSEVMNRRGPVLCGADMDHVIAKPQLRYQESTNPRILKMARTVPMLTTRGGHPLFMDRKKSPNLWICRNYRNGRIWIKILYRCDGFLDIFEGQRNMRNMMDIGNDMVILIIQYDSYTVWCFSNIVIFLLQFYATIDQTCGILKIPIFQNIVTRIHNNWSIFLDIVGGYPVVP